MLTHTRDELQEYFLTFTGFSHGDPGVLSIQGYSAESIVATTTFDESHLRPGGTVAGPAIFSVVDQMGFLVTMSRAPKGSNGFTTAVTMEFLRPVVGTLRVEGRLLRFGKRSSVVDIVLYGDSLDEPVVHAVVTYLPQFPPG